MATFHESKYVGRSFFSSTKSGRSNSALDLLFEGGDQLLEKKKGVISKKKKVITCLAARFATFLGRKRHKKCRQTGDDLFFLFLFLGDHPSCHSTLADWD